MYFKFLKNTDPLYGLNFETQLPYYIKVNVGISIAIILYQRAYPEEADNEIYPIVLQYIQENLNNCIIPTINQIKELRNNI